MPNDGPQGIGRSIGHPHTDTHYVHCDNCGADGPVHDTEYEARAAWNRRPVTSESELVPLMAPCEGGPILPDSCSDCRREGSTCAIAALAQQAATCQPLADERPDTASHSTLAILNLPIIRDGAGRAMLDRKAVECILMDWDRAAIARQSPSIDQQGGAPAKPIYQAWHRGNGGWDDCNEREYNSAPETDRRIVYIAAPSPSAEDDQDAKDADRYRWLLEDPANVTWGDFYDRTSHGPNWSVSDAIDAAMSQAKGTGKKEDDPRVRELIEAARPFTSGDIVDETSGTTHLMARLQSAIEEFDNE